jgi:hypothetical protein
MRSASFAQKVENGILISLQSIKTFWPSGASAAHLHFEFNFEFFGE